MNLGDIAPKSHERAFIAGGTRTGKSTLLDHLVRHIVRMTPTVELLLLDSKPRFRAQYTTWGRDAKRFYETWSPAPVVPNSVVADLDDEYPLKRAWKNPERRIVILQGEDKTDHVRMLQIADDWYRKPHKGKRMLVVDELMDFYLPNGWCIAPQWNVPLKVVRAGGERDIGGMYGSQRTKGIPPQMVQEITHLFLFHLRNAADLKYLRDMGIPSDLVPPDEDYAFHTAVIRPGGRTRIRENLRLQLDPGYARQLAKT